MLNQEINQNYKNKYQINVLICGILKTMQGNGQCPMKIKCIHFDNRTKTTQVEEENKEERFSGKRWKGISALVMNMTW